jgi:hypothetical protein
MRTEGPFSLSSLEKISCGFCSPLRKSRPQGLATLSAAYVLPSLEAFFSPQRSWVSPYRAFASLLAIEAAFPPVLFAPALPCITSSATHRRFSDLLPPREPSPLLLPGGLTRVGVACSPELSGLPGTPLQRTARRESPSSNSPHVLFLLLPRDRGIPEPQGIACRQSRLPPHGAPTCLAFSTDRPHHLFKKVTRRGLFFHLERPWNLTTPRCVR